MTCQHLQPLEQALLARSIRETFRGRPWSGRPWSQNCREWVYFDCFIDTAAVCCTMSLADCVHEHAHQGTHDGQERGFVCTQCHDGIIGNYEPRPGGVIFKG